MDYKITYNEFQKRLKWNINQKIDHALYTIESFNNIFPNSSVSFSGGIDSTVLLWLVRKISSNKKAVFINTTNEFIETIQFVKNTQNVEIIKPKINFIQTVEKYGFPLISKRVARMLHDIRNPTENNKHSRNLYLTGIKRNGEKNPFYILAKKYRHLIDAPFNVTDKCCYHLKKSPSLFLNKNGIFIGTLATESEDRRMSYLKTGCINLKKNIGQPLSIFYKNEIWKIVKDNNIKYCDLYNRGECSLGCAYCGFGFQFDRMRFFRLQQRDPKRYKQMIGIKNNGITYKQAIEYTFGKCGLFC